MSKSESCSPDDHGESTNARRNTVPKLESRRSRIRAVALVFALATVLIVAVLVLGITTVTQQHYNLARVQTDSAAALNVAEAAMQYELNNMSRAEYGEPVTVHNTSALAYDGYLTGLSGADT